MFSASSSLSFVWLVAPGIVVAVGLTTAVALAWTGVRRPGVLAGIITAFLCGQSFFGRILPESHERLFMGGVNERTTLSEFDESVQSERLALQESGVTPVAIDEWQITRERERIELVALYDAATADHTRGMRFLTCMCAAVIIGWLCPRTRHAPSGSAMSTRRPTTGSEPRPAIRPLSWHDALFATLWMYVLVIGFLGGALLFVFKAGRIDALAVSLTFVVTGAPLVSHRHEMRGTPGRDFMKWSSSRITLIGWVAGIIAVITFASSSPGIDTTTLVAATIAFVASFVYRMLREHLSNDGPRASVLSAILGFGLVPAMTGFGLLSVDFLSWNVVWPVVLAIVVGGDGRWFGSASGMRLVGVPWRVSWRTALPVADAGATHAAVGAVLWCCGWVTAGPYIAAIAAGAAMCDLTVELRGRLLERVEDEVNAADEPEDAHDDDMHEDRRK